MKLPTIRERRNTTPVQSPQNLKLSTGDTVVRPQDVLTGADVALGFWR